MVVPGADQMDFLTAAFEAGMFPDIEGTTEDYIAQRRRRQHELRRAVDIHFSNGVWVQVNERPTHDGGYAAVYIDITERKRAEQELAEKEPTPSCTHLFRSAAEDVRSRCERPAIRPTASPHAREHSSP